MKIYRFRFSDGSKIRDAIIYAEGEREAYDKFTREYDPDKLQNVIML